MTARSPHPTNKKPGEFPGFFRAEIERHTAAALPKSGLSLLTGGWAVCLDFRPAALARALDGGRRRKVRNTSRSLMPMER